MKRAAVLLAVVLLAIVITLVWRADSGSSSVDAPFAEEAEGGPEPPSVLSDDASAESARASLPRSTASFDPALPTAIERSGLEIVVIDAATQTVVSDADVFVGSATSTAHAWLSDPWLRINDCVESIESQGVRYRTDERGRVVIPPIEQSTIVIAKRDERRGAAELKEWTTGPFEIEIQRDFDVTVQVVDSSGIPLAGTPVALSFGGAWSSTETEVVATRGPEALAKLHYVGLAFGLKDDEQGFVSLAGLFDPPVRVALDPGRPPLERIVLVAPPAGELEVVMKDADGAVDPEAGWLRVEIMRRRPGILQEPLSMSWTGTLREGGVVLPRVALGSRFQVTVRCNGSDAERRAEIEGPTLPQERVTLTIGPHADESTPVIVARLLDERGVPLVSTPVVVTTNVASHRSPNQRPQTTDRFGRLRIRDRDAAKGSPSTEMFFAQEDLSRRTRYVAYGSTPLSADPLNVVQDVGDVVLKPGPRIVSGRVLDQDLAAVPDARIALDFEGTWTGFWPSAMKARSDASGRFELSGLSFAERLFVRAEANGVESERVEFRPGADSVDLLVRQTGEIGGVVRTPGSIKRSDYWIDVAREDSKTAEPYEMSRELDGRFRAYQLSTGVYRIKVQLAQEQSMLLDVGGLQVVGGERLEPLELNPLDVSTRMHAHALTVRDAVGQLVSPLGVTWRAAGHPSTPKDPHSYFYDGRARIVSMHERIDADLEAAGWRIVRALDVSGEREFVTTRAIRVKLVLDADSPLPSPPFRLMPYLGATVDAPNVRVWTGEVFSPSRECYIDALASGPRAVQFTLYKGEEWRPESEIQPTVPLIITITEEPEQTFTVTVPAADLQRAIAAFPP